MAEGYGTFIMTHIKDLNNLFTMPHKIRFARLIFNVQTLKADGKAYEDIFTSVQILLDNTFRKIKPYGNVGDKKNDGFLPKTGNYFQVYAPENPEKSRTIKNAISKLVNDFTGLYKACVSTPFFELG